MKLDNQNKVEIMFGIPMVRREPFGKYLAVPIPDLAAGAIPSTPITEVLASQTLQEYIEGDIVYVQINDTVSMTSKTITTVQIPTNETSCAIRTLLYDQPQCALMKMPEQFDSWIETPLHNGIIFYSNQKREMICPTIRYQIKEQVGMLYLPQECHVKTSQKKIYASWDKTTIKRNYFHIPMLDTQLNFSLPEPSPKASRKFQIDSEQNNELDDVLAEATDDSSTTMVQIILITALSVISAIAAIATYIFYKIKTRPNQAVELELTDTHTHHESSDDKLAATLEQAQQK